MRALVMSDLHLEFEPAWRRSVEHVSRQGKPKLRPAARTQVERWAELAALGHPKLGPELPTPGAIDLVLLAGDIHIGAEASAYAAGVARWLGCPVVLVPGNHEFYKLDMQVALTDMRVCAEAMGAGRVHLLDRGRLDMECDGRRVAVLGTTLWTDYELNGDVVTAMAEATEQLADHKLIRWMSGDTKKLGGGHHFRPEHALALHRDAHAWLAEETPRARAEADLVLVATHHAPVASANPPQYQGGPLSPAFASDMTAEIAAWAPDLWVFGHTHWDVDERLGVTRLVASQRGYLGEDEGAENYRPLVVTLTPKA